MRSEFPALGSEGYRRPPPFAERIEHTRPVLPDLDGLHQRLSKVWDSKILTNGGAMATALESALSERLGAPHLSLFTNGTIALQVALQVQDLAPGEVITTPFTFPGTPHAIHWAGFEPVFADVDPSTMNLSPEAVERAITDRTRAILAVHVFGIPCDVVALEKLARAHGLKVIYDAAHAFEARVNGRPVADYGDAVMFSLHATKLFHTGEGGALAVSSPELNERVRWLRNFGMAGPETVMLPGTNGKMSELSAALGLEVLAVLDDERRRRAAIARIYHANLSQLPGVTLPKSMDEADDSLQYFPILIEEADFGLSRDTLMEQLREFNVSARRYFYPLCSHFEAYRRLPSAAPEGLPNAEVVVQRVLCMPYYGGLSDDDAQHICDIIKYLHRTAEGLARR